MIERDDVIRILKRTFKAGVMRRLPKKREDAKVMMALSLVELDPDGIFDESEINVHLSAWLDVIGIEDGISDYVTLRRALVDSGFLRRASDGAVYRLIPERLDGVLSPEAKTIDPKQIFAEVEAARIERRRNFSKN